MNTIFALLFFFSFILFLIGLFSPRTSLFWDKKNELTKKRSGIVYGIAFVSSFILFGITAEKNTKTTTNATETVSNNTAKSESDEKDDLEKKTEATKSTQIGIGDVLQTDYFEIKANKISLKERISTGNEFADLKPEEGITYLIINATFKNTDNESRMLIDGSVWINYNGKDYEFDKSETVMLEGWGIMLDQLNPLTSKTTNLVYKIPTEIKGDAYWQPGRADSDQKIFLGSL